MGTIQQTFIVSSPEQEALLSLSKAILSDVDFIVIKAVPLGKCYSASTTDILWQGLACYQGIIWRHIYTVLYQS